MSKTIGWSGQLLAALCLGAAVFSYAQAQPAGPPGSAMPPPPVAGEPSAGADPAPPPIEKLAPGIFKIGEITLNKNTRGLAFPAQVNMDKGLLEYLLVQARGKTHESLLRTRVEPYHLQIAFLLLGFEGTDRPLRFQGDPDKPRGDALEIIIGYPAKAGGLSEIKAEEWLAKGAEGGPGRPGNMGWTFTGSVVLDGRFLAQSEGSIAAIFHDPAALIDNVAEGGESDKVWFVNEGTVPPVGTPVTVTIRKKMLK